MAKKKIDETQLQATIGQQIELAKVYDREERDGDRTKAIEYFFGNIEKDLPHTAGRSSAVSRDVSDTIGWMLPGIIDVFTASDRMAIADPAKPSDEEWADQATDGLNHTFMKENDGYETIYQATWDALLTGNGIVKVFYDDAPVYKTSFHSGLTDDELTLLLEPEDDDDEIDVLEHTQDIDELSVDGQVVQITMHDVKIKRKVTSGQHRVECIPPEDFLIDADATCIEEAAFKAHKQGKTRSQLIEMGFDAEKVAAIPKTSGVSSEDLAREIDIMSEAPDESMELVTLYECYARMDMSGTGVAETVRVMYAGDEGGGAMLDWEIWEDEEVFADLPCYPVPHRWRAESVADKTMDIMLTKSSMQRQFNDNIYGTNNPQRFATGKILNPNALVNPQFGETIFGDAGSTVTPLTVPFVAGHALEGLGYQDELIQKRTGVGRQSMALDPEALQNQTATANQNNKDAAYSQIELIAKNMAEFGWKQVFRLLLRSMVKHQNKAKTIRLRDEWVEIDPRHWNADMDITINVGLGTGSRDRDAQMLNNVLMHQRELATSFYEAGFKDKAIEMLPFIHNTLTKFAESTGLKNPEAYYPPFEPEELEAAKQRIAEQEAQPDPELQLKQAELQSKMELEKQKAQAQVNREQAQMEADIVVGDKERAYNLQLEQLKQQNDALRLQIERDKNDINAALKDKEIESRREVELIKLGVSETADGKKIPKVDQYHLETGQTLSELRDMLGGIAGNATAPRRIARDENGPYGIEKFINGEWHLVETVTRDQLGRVAGTQPIN